MAPQLSRATQHHYGGLTCENNYAYERAWATCGHFKQEKKSLASLLFGPSSSALFQKLRDSPTTRRDVHGETIALGLMLLLWRRDDGVVYPRNEPSSCPVDIFCLFRRLARER